MKQVNSKKISPKKISKLRADFPIFQKKDQLKTGDFVNENFNPSIIYLDNAATTQIPQIVIEQMVDYYANFKANIGRGSGFIANQTLEKVEQVRKKVHNFLNSNENMGQVIWTAGATESLNLVALSLYKHFKKVEINGRKIKENSTKIDKIGEKLDKEKNSISSLERLDLEKLEKTSFLESQSQKQNFSIRNLAEKNLEKTEQNLTETFGSNYQVIISQMEHHSNFLAWQEYFDTKVWQFEKKLASQNLKKNEEAESVNSQKNLGKNKENLELSWEFLKSLITTQTKILAISHCSNLTGQILPIKNIIAKIRAISPDICVVVDGSQAVLHSKIDVQDLDYDFYVFSAHKLFGSTGSGVLWGKNKWLAKLEPPKFGGGMVETVSWQKMKTGYENENNSQNWQNLEQNLETLENLKQNSTWRNLPHSWEAGTLNIAGIIGLGAAIDYLKNGEKEGLLDWEMELFTYLKEKICEIEDLETVETVGFSDFLGLRKNTETRDNFFQESSVNNSQHTILPKISTKPENHFDQNFTKKSNQTPILSFYHKSLSSFDLAEVLSLSGICLRSGSFCCQPFMESLAKSSLLRVSLAPYNTFEEVDFFINKLKSAIQLLEK